VASQIGTFAKRNPAPSAVSYRKSGCRDVLVVEQALDVFDGFLAIVGPLDAAELKYARRAISGFAPLDPSLEHGGNRTGEVFDAGFDLGGERSGDHRATPGNFSSLGIRTASGSQTSLLAPFEAGRS
jgi:hypothetical protein